MAATCACVARTHTAPPAWRYPRERRVANLANLANQPTATAPAVSSAAAKPPPAQQLTVQDKFAPWLAELRVQLREIGLAIIKLTQGQDLSRLDDASDDDEAPKAEAAIMHETQALAARLGSLRQLVHEQLLPKQSTSAEALFLASAAEFIGRSFEPALRLARESLMCVQSVGERELASRHYYVACCCFRLLHSDGSPGSGIAPPTPARRAELLDLAEASLRRAAGLAPRFPSAWIDIETLCSLRHPSDQIAQAAAAGALAEQLLAPRGGLAAGSPLSSEGSAFWRSAWQRPMAMLKLRSQPWYEASELSWAPALLQAFGTIRDEVLRTRRTAKPSVRAAGDGGASGKGAAAEAGGASPHWDAVGSRHDRHDGEIVEGGAWTELVLANIDKQVASSVKRARQLCPQTAALLDRLPAAADMAKAGVGECTFSALGPGAHLKPHCGSSNARLTAHLPLVVPPGCCSIRVGGETRPYREGELLVFDDSYEHEVWNTSATDVRIVLLIRFWHPDVPPSEYGARKRELDRMYRRHQRAATMPPLF